jgi:hypothetical protein
MREGEQVTPLELFFDLVFVLALTQRTTLITRTPTACPRRSRPRRSTALLTLGILAALLSALIAYEAIRYSDVRDRVRHQLAWEPVPEPVAEGAAVDVASL